MSCSILLNKPCGKRLNVAVHILRQRNAFSTTIASCSMQTYLRLGSYRILYTKFTAKDSHCCMDSFELILVV